MIDRMLLVVMGIAQRFRWAKLNRWAALTHMRRQISN